MTGNSREYRTFVTVGTHEQPFDRLITAVDELAEKNVIPTPAFIQIGYCTRIPKFCDWKRFVSWESMKMLMNNADLVVTHGGPSSFMEAIEAGKIPVVVPRSSRYGEHVNDHQSEFAHSVENRIGGIVVVDDVCALSGAIELARNKSAKEITSNNRHFCTELEIRIDRLMRSQ